MPYVIIGFVIFLSLAGWKVYDYGVDSGVATEKAAALTVTNAEIVDLNRQNKEMQDTIDRERRENIDEHFTREVRANQKLKELALAKDIAADKLGTDLRVQLDAAQNAGENKSYTQNSGFTSIISGLAGTEGAKLTPETRYHLELMSIFDEETAVLFGSCIAQAVADRK